MPTMLFVLAVGSTKCYLGPRPLVFGIWGSSLISNVDYLLVVRSAMLAYIYPSYTLFCWFFAFFHRKAQSQGWRTNCAERSNRCIRRPAPCHSEWCWLSYWTSFLLLIKMHRSKVFVVVLLNPLSFELFCLWVGQKILSMFCIISMSALGIVPYFLGGIN